MITLQLAFIILLGLSAKVVPATLSGWLLVTGGLAIGGWAILEMRHSKLRVQPEVATDAILITTGPYRFIRNPMYLSVLLVTAGWLLDRLIVWRVLIWLALVVTLTLKLKFEELLLRVVFPDYEKYSKTTKRLIPFIW